MGELEFREVRLTDPTDRRGRTTIDQRDVGTLQAEIDELESEMLDLEDRLDGLRIALVTASRLGSNRSHVWSGRPHAGTPMSATTKHDPVAGTTPHRPTHGRGGTDG